ncbi:MAG: 50S ribosomal protein P1 [Candidatus Altiarchaeales archaeon ex4484_2]|nr:MAG: 50S ribosomal protein P1 [Candidatus Altiarchaeales archaeon ex4484_2]
MEYVYGAMLLHSAGQDVNEENIEKVMKSSGVKVDSTRVKALVSALEGVDIDEAMSTAAIAPTAAPAATEEAKEEKKKEKPKEEEKTEEDAASGLASLFE